MTPHSPRRGGQAGVFVRLYFSFNVQQLRRRRRRHPGSRRPLWKNGFFCPVAVRVRKQLRIRARYLLAVRKGREGGKGGALLRVDIRGPVAFALGRFGEHPFSQGKYAS